MVKSIELTPDMAEGLLDSGGTTCPKCESQDVSFNDHQMHVENDTIERVVTCRICGCNWRLTYKLMDVSDWQDPGMMTQERATQRATKTCEYDRVARAISNKINHALAADGQELQRVIYSAGGLDENDLPIDNLDEVAVEGRCKFLAEAGWNEEGEDYESDWVENPTWLQVSVLANKMLHTVKDGHHLYLEGVRKSGRKPGIYRFVMGS